MVPDGEVIHHFELARDNVAITRELSARSDPVQERPWDWESDSQGQPKIDQSETLYICIGICLVIWSSVLHAISYAFTGEN